MAVGAAHNDIIGLTRPYVYSRSLCLFTVKSRIQDLHAMTTCGAVHTKQIAVQDTRRSSLQPQASSNRLPQHEYGWLTGLACRQCCSVGKCSAETLMAGLLTWNTAHRWCHIKFDLTSCRSGQVSHCVSKVCSDRPHIGADGSVSSFGDGEVSFAHSLYCGRCCIANCRAYFIIILHFTL